MSIYTRRAQILCTSASLVAALAAAAPVLAAETWPTAVHARYKLRFNGIDVGHIDFNSKTSARDYAMGGTGEVSVLFGAIKWSGASTVSGAITATQPLPKNYAFNWTKKSKGGAIAMKYAGGKATDISVEPSPNTGPDVIPLTDAHRVGPVDPLTAIMMLTKADGTPPCERKVAVFDGKHRYDIALAFKRHTHIPASHAGGGSVIGVVCQATYTPIAGFKNDANHKAYAANRDAELVLRPVPGTKLMIPHAVIIPTSWGTGSMVTDRIDVTTTAAGQVALTD